MNDKDRHLKIDTTLSLFCDLLGGRMSNPEASAEDINFTPLPRLSDEQKLYNKQVIKRWFGDIPYSDDAIDRQEVLARRVIFEVATERGDNDIAKTHSDSNFEKLLEGSKKTLNDEQVSLLSKLLYQAFEVLPNPYYRYIDGTIVYQMVNTQALWVYYSFIYNRLYHKQNIILDASFEDKMIEYRLAVDYEMGVLERKAGGDEEKLYYLSHWKKIILGETDHILGKWCLASARNQVIQCLDRTLLSGGFKFQSPVLWFNFHLMPWLFERDGFKRLKNDMFWREVDLYVKKPIYLSLAPNDAMPPYATYTLEQVQELKDKSGYWGLDIVVRFDFYTHTPTAVSDESWLGFMRGVNVKNKQLVGHNGGIIITECDMIDMSLDKVDSVTYDKSYTYHYQVQWADNMISIN